MCLPHVLPVLGGTVLLTPSNDALGILTITYGVLIAADTVAIRLKTTNFSLVLVLNLALFLFSLQLVSIHLFNHSRWKNSLSLI